jgi:hypothetical protein
MGHGAFRIPYLRPEGIGRHDVDFVAQVDVTNNTTTALEIVGYTLEAKVNGVWEQLKRVELLSPVAEWSPDIAPEPIYLDMSNTGFEILARSTALEPGHSMKGWTFYAWPTSPASFAGIQALRFTVFDNKGGRTPIVQSPLVRPEDSDALITGGLMKPMPKGWRPPWGQQ